MNKLFLDSDVLLDLLLDRKPFSEDIKKLIANSIAAGVELYTSPISITNIHYIVGRLENKARADIMTRKILEIVRMEPVNQQVIEQAAQSNFKDFEDSVQNFCAVLAGHRIILSRNTKDYKESQLSILNPKEYLAKMENE